MHFTGKQRDTETNLDDFPARYYSSVQGRWLSPDWDTKPVSVPYAILGNPQTLNLYSYVGGDPTNHADADGHIFLCVTCANSADSSSEDQNQGSGQPGDKAQNRRATVSQQEITQNAATGAVVGGVVGGVVGSIVGGTAGGAVGTLAEPGGGTLGGIVLGGTEGAKDGAVAGAVAGAAAGVLYTQSKDALQKVGQHLDTALEHIGKLNNSPDQNPRNKWKETVRKSADNIDKQSARIANKTLSNAGHYVADLLRGLVN
jgi:RHS repeat-associated protein